MSVRVEAKSDFRTWPRFLVIQNGARHGYAIPAAFLRQGALSALYTDFTATHGFGPLLKSLSGKRSRIASALARRTPPEEIAGTVLTSGGAFIAGQALRFIHRGTDGVERAHRLSQSLAERIMLSRGTGCATHIYTMLGEGGRFIQKAKQSGLGVVGDVYIALSADRIVTEEITAFPDWSDRDCSSTVKEEVSRRNRFFLETTDLFVCPSEFVRDDLVVNHGVDASRTCVVPYAVSPSWLSLDSMPEKGRLLFAGSANLRKGIHYLAMAATLLGGSYKFLVAGEASRTVRGHPASKNLTFLGHLSKSDMAAEFARADVFVFPSIAEGAASVVAEALGAGVPVVTTKAAGSIVRDGIDGIVVPERSPDALAKAVLSIVGNRDRRDAMSSAARERAQAFSWDGFACKVIGATQRAFGNEVS